MFRRIEPMFHAETNRHHQYLDVSVDVLKTNGLNDAVNHRRSRIIVAGDISISAPTQQWSRRIMTVSQRARCTVACSIRPALHR